MSASRRSRIGSAVISAVMGLVALGAPAAEAAQHRHRHRRPVDPPPAEQAVPPGPRERAAYQSGYAFGLLDLGISGTPTAISPYAGAGYVRPGYDGPGFGYPGY